MNNHWKSILTVLFMAVVLSPAAFAGNSGVVIATESGYSPVAAHFEMDADFVVITLKVDSKATNPVNRLIEVEQLHKRIVTAVNSESKIDLLSSFVSVAPGAIKSYPSFGYRVYQGKKTNAAAALSPRRPDLYPRERHKDEGSAVKSYLLIRLDESTNVFSATRQATEFVSGIEDIGQAKASIGRAVLGVENPEQYRGDLLEEIAEEVASLKKHLSPNASVQVSGLESPVRIRQKDGRVVTVFLSYTISISY